MHLSRLILALLLFIGFQADARVRAVRHPSAALQPASVLWVAAHPDDEAVAAPLLAKWCRDDRVRCGFLVLTRGEAGPCLRPDGCLPDTASVRSAEAGSASQLFGADSILLTFPDGGGGAPPTWDTPMGDRSDVVSIVAGHIEAFRPDLILTFDPRHGTTCHPDHRETGRIVVGAVRRLAFNPRLYLLETRVSITSAPFEIHFGSAVEGAERFDATQVLSGGAAAWEAIIQDMRRHPSQFDDRWIAAIDRVPLRERAVFIAPAETVLQQPVAGCP